jgi:hypothetical protein
VESRESSLLLRRRHGQKLLSRDISVWKVLGGSVIGQSHIDSGTVCQDASGWWVSESGVCAVVADGAGSRPKSEQGSALIVQTILEWARDAMNEDQSPSIYEGLMAARQALEVLSSNTGMPLRDYASTVSVVLVDKRIVQVGQVGDCFVVMRKADASVETVSPPARSEYVNEAVFLTADDWEQDLRISEVLLDDVRGFCLSSDGLQFDLLDDIATGTPYAPFFDDAFSWAIEDSSTSEDLLLLVASLGQQSHDDMSLIIGINGSLRDSSPTDQMGIADQPQQT